MCMRKNFPFQEIILETLCNAHYHISRCTIFSGAQEKYQPVFSNVHIPVWAPRWAKRAVLIDLVDKREVRRRNDV